MVCVCCYIVNNICISTDHEVYNQWKDETLEYVILIYVEKINALIYWQKHSLPQLMICCWNIAEHIEPLTYCR